MIRLTPIVKQLLIVNVIVFFVWAVAKAEMIDGLLLFMHKYFKLFTLGGILGPRHETAEFFRPIQIVTSMFSHMDLTHIAMNMLGLVFIGPAIEMMMGSKRFLVFYLFSGIVGGILIAVLDPVSTAVLGASGAISGILAAFAYMAPNQRLYLFGVVGVKAKQLAIGFAAYSAVMIVAELRLGDQMANNVSHFGHLMGMAAAALYFKIEKYIPIGRD